MKFPHISTPFTLPEGTEKYLKEFLEFAAKENLKREKAIVLIGIVITVVNVLINVLFGPASLLISRTGTNLAMTLNNYFVETLSPFILIYIVASFPSRTKPVGVIHHGCDILAETLLIVFTASIIFFVSEDPFNTEFEATITIFHLIMLFISFFIIQTTIRSILILSSGSTIILLGMLFWNSKNLLTAQECAIQTMSGLLILCISIGFARKSFTSRLIRFRNTKIIEEQNKLLEKTNMELIRANIQLDMLSSLDGLTHIPNRRSFENHLEREWKRAVRHRHPIALIMIDIDKFKSYNDTYGHLEGDLCLQEVAQALSREIKRPGEIVARYGGEEFAVILPFSDTSQAYVMGERLRRAVYSLDIEHSGLAWGKVTISVGIASTVPPGGGRPQVLLKTADFALYQAKKDGRNRVCFTKELIGN